MITAVSSASPKIEGVMNGIKDKARLGIRDGKDLLTELVIQDVTGEEVQGETRVKTKEGRRSIDYKRDVSLDLLNTLLTIRWLQRTKTIGKQAKKEDLTFNKELFYTYAFRQTKTNKQIAETTRKILQTVINNNMENITGNIQPDTLINTIQNPNKTQTMITHLKKKITPLKDRINEIQEKIDDNNLSDKKKQELQAEKQEKETKKQKLEAKKKLITNLHEAATHGTNITPLFNTGNLIKKGSLNELNKKTTRYYLNTRGITTTDSTSPNEMLEKLHDYEMNKLIAKGDPPNDHDNEDDNDNHKKHHHVVTRFWKKLKHQITFFESMPAFQRIQARIMTKVKQKLGMLHNGKRTKKGAFLSQVWTAIKVTLLCNLGRILGHTIIQFTPQLAAYQWLSLPPSPGPPQASSSPSSSTNSSAATTPQTRQPSFSCSPSVVVWAHGHANGNKQTTDGKDGSTPPAPTSPSAS